MAGDKGVFQRIEQKYMLTDAQYKALLPIIKANMHSDEYSNYTIANIYYDTDDFEFIRSSIEKPKYKEKLRLRSYGTPKYTSKVFVELKKKVGGVVYKRRESMKLADAYEFLGGDAKKCDTQIGRELAWFIAKNDVSPKVMIAYDRIAFAGNENSDFRLTFDTNIRWRNESVDLAKGTWGQPLLEKGQHLMEVKIPGAMPLFMAKAMSDLGIFPTSFSKYGEVYKQNLCGMIKAGGAYCA